MQRRMPGGLAALALITGLSVGCAVAAPSVGIYGGNATIREGLDAGVKDRLKNARPVKFSLEDATDADLAGLCALFPEMLELAVFRGNITSLAPLAGLGRLKSLVVDGVRTADFSPLAALTELQEIVIVDSPLENLSWMQGMMKLGSVTIHANSLTSLEGLPASPRLQAITLNGCAPRDLAPLAGPPRLRTLRMRGAILPDMASLAGADALRILDIAGSRLSDGQSPESVREYFPRIERLVLTGQEQATEP